jgi:diacylglycerol kinase family enzyme
MVSNDPLTEPLLSSNNNADYNNSTMVEWPETPVPLYVPKEWQTKHDDHQQQQCHFLYDKEDNLLRLVQANSTDTIIDVLDPEDIIGVTVEISMADAVSSSPRAVAETNIAEEPTDDRPANAPATDTPTDTQGHAVLVVYAYPREDPNHPLEKSSSLVATFCGTAKVLPKPNPNYKRPTGDEEWQTWGRRYAFHRRLKVVASEDVGSLNALVQAICTAAQLPTDRGRALVMVNPFSGPNRSAEQMYEETVQILLEQSQIDHDVCVTTHANHAKERMAKGYRKNNASSGHSDEDKKDILEYSAIICMGGDGIVHEVLQGIKERDDWGLVLKQVTLGIIGAGTSNGMAKSVAHTSQQQSSVLDATFLIAKGYTHPTDLSLYQTQNNEYWSFLTFSWAMLADIDIDSEVIRFVGSLRFDLWAVWCVLHLKKYRAKLSYLPAKSKTDTIMPTLGEPIDSGKNKDWVTEEDDFLLFWAAHVSHAAEKTYNSPQSRLDDGVFQILVVR